MNEENVGSTQFFEDERGIDDQSIERKIIQVIQKSFNLNIESSVLELLDIPMFLEPFKLSVVDMLYLTVIMEKEFKTVFSTEQFLDYGLLTVSSIAKRLHDNSCKEIRCGNF